MGTRVCVRFLGKCWQAPSFPLLSPPMLLHTCSIKERKENSWKSVRPSLCQGHYSQLLSSSLLVGGKGILFTITPRPHLWTHNLPSGPVFALSHTHTHAHTHTNTHQFLFHLAYFNFIIHFSIVSQWRVSDRLVWTQKASVIQGKIEWYNGGGSKGFVARKHTLPPYNVEKLIFLTESVWNVVNIRWGILGFTSLQNETGQGCFLQCVSQRYL